MTNIRKLLRSLTLLALALPAPAFSAATLLTVKSPAPVELKRSGKGEARFHVTVAPGYHVQSNPASDNYLIATTLKLRAVRGVRAGKPAYPKGEVFRLEGSPDSITTYAGTFDIVVPVRATDEARAGLRVLQGTLRYQACDSKSCLAPRTVPIKLSVAVLKSRSRLTGVHASP